MRSYYELQQSDVGRPFLKIFDRVWSVKDFLGRVLPGDVGKRVYLVSGILQVENDAQRAERLEATRKEDQDVPDGMRHMIPILPCTCACGWVLPNKIEILAHGVGPIVEVVFMCPTCKTRIGAPTKGAGQS